MVPDGGRYNEKHDGGVSCVIVLSSSLYVVPRSSTSISLVEIHCPLDETSCCCCACRMPMSQLQGRRVARLSWPTPSQFDPIGMSRCLRHAHVGSVAQHAPEHLLLAWQTGAAFTQPMFPVYFNTCCLQRCVNPSRCRIHSQFRSRSRSVMVLHFRVEDALKTIIEQNNRKWTHFPEMDPLSGP